MIENRFFLATPAPLLVPRFVVIEAQLVRWRFTMYVQPLDGSLTSNSLAGSAVNAESEGALLQGGAVPAGDNISRFLPPWLNNDAADSAYGDGYGSSGSMQGIFGSLMGVLQQLTQMLQSLMGYGCGTERYFRNANGSSDGDPHLSFNGSKWNDMASQPNLVCSDSFAGGFRVSTQVTPTNGKGVTWNQSATVALNNGATTITLNNDGQASITSDGQQLSIARGQTLQLGDDESVTCEQSGALRVQAQNGAGGRLETTLSPEGKGVNVDVTAHDVDLGGALVNGPASSSPISGPIWGRFPGPTPVMGPFPLPDPFGPQQPL
jgi:hypothetical protein